jgi:hypothetical protein
VLVLSHFCAIFHAPICADQEKASAELLLSGENRFAEVRLAPKESEPLKQFLIRTKRAKDWLKDRGSIPLASKCFVINHLQRLGDNVSILFR